LRSPGTATSGGPFMTPSVSRPAAAHRGPPAAPDQPLPTSTSRPRRQPDPPTGRRGGREPREDGGPRRNRGLLYINESPGQPDRRAAAGCAAERPACTARRIRRNAQTRSGPGAARAVLAM
jgi:hypothetical protein